MKNINVAKKLLEEDYNFFSSQMIEYTERLENKLNIEYEKSPIAVKSINDNLIKIAKSSLISDGKRIRPLFCYWIFRTFSNKKEDFDYLIDKVTKIALSIEILHNASLVIDDIEDGSIERRNKTALHICYGIPNSLNAATWMYFLAINNLPESLQALASNALIDCHIGQSLDLNSSQKSFAEQILNASCEERWKYYESCVALKTTRLIMLSLQCLEKVLDLNKLDFNFIENIIKKYGLIYQVFDDIKNVFPELSGNKLNEDLKTGFRSAISIEFLNILPEDEMSHAYEIFQSECFFAYMLKHKKFNQAIQNCFKKAENLSNECSKYIDNYPEIDSIFRLYLAQIFDSPFSEIRDNLSLKINQDFSNFTQENYAL